MKKLVYAFIIVLFAFAGCKKDSEINTKVIDPSAPVISPTDDEYGQVKITFNQMVGSTIMKLDTTTYYNYAEQDYKLTKFKFYISNISLTRTDGSVYKQRESYHLINVSKGSTYNLILDSVPLGDYQSVNFILGVDSTRNCSGAQTGALDPTNGLFWSWNQGYIFLIMEGSSTQSALGNKSLIFHLGGFIKPYNCIRFINPSLGTNIISVKKDNLSKVIIKTDGAKLFGTQNIIDFIHNPSAMGGAVGVLVADNCTKMFSITSVEN